MSTSYSLYYGKFIKLNQEIINTTKKIKICPNKNCKSYNKEVEGEFCSKCGSKLITSKIKDKIKVQQLIEDEAIKNDIDIDLIISEYYEPNIIYIDGMMKYAKPFEIISTKDIKKVSKNNNEIYNFIINLLKDKNISFKEIVGSYLQIG